MCRRGWRRAWNLTGHGADTLPGVRQPPQAPVPTALPPAQQQQWWQPDPSGHRRWASSTYLLCYGQMAAQAGARILPWVDNIVSRIVHHYSCGSCVSPAPVPRLRQTGWAPTARRLLLTVPACPSVQGQDSALKTSFLSAATMLTNALQWEKDAQSYKFTQIPELIHCLLVSDPRARPSPPSRCLRDSQGTRSLRGWARPHPYAASHSACPVHPSEGAQLPGHPLPAEDHTGHHGAQVTPLEAQEKRQVGPSREG